jgi:hypothetical protein
MGCGEEGSIRSSYWRIRSRRPTSREGANRRDFLGHRGFWEIECAEERAFFEHFQRQSVRIICQRCDRLVRLMSTKTICAPCTSALECGAPTAMSKYATPGRKPPQAHERRSALRAARIGRVRGKCWGGFDDFSARPTGRYRPRALCPHRTSGVALHRPPAFARGSHRRSSPARTRRRGRPRRTTLQRALTLVLPATDGGMRCRSGSSLKPPCADETAAKAAPPQNGADRGLSNPHGAVEPET